MTPNWTSERPTKPGEYWLSIDPNKRKGRIDCEHNGGDGIMTDYRNGVRAAAGIIALIMGLCAVASLSGCATPAKLKAEALRMDALGQAAERACGSACSQRQIACAKAAASALRAISEALRVQATATKYTTGALAPDVSAAIHAADEECKP